MKKILLIGNPNVGKSAVFSHLTGINVTTSNYPGTTVQYTKGKMTYEGKGYEIIDVPGTYRLETNIEAEKVAVDMIKSGDILVNVLDSSNLERNLNLTLQLMEFGKPMIVVLNMWDDTKHKGIRIDYKKLERLLNIPVVTSNGLTGAGLKELQKKCVDVKPVKKTILDKELRWKKIGDIVSQVQNLSHRHHTLIETIQDLMINPVFGVPIALLVIYLSFKFVIAIGEFFVDFALKVFDILYTPIVLWVSNILGGQGVLHSILIGNIEGRTVDYEGAMGVITTGVFIVFGVVLPYIISFYIVFGFLEDLGYLSRIAVIFDRILHRIGLHGYSVIPMMLAFGCNVPGILAIRNLESRRERFITAVITCITIPCMAQTALVIRAVGSRGGIYLLLTYTTLVTVWAVLGMFLKSAVSGNTQTLLIEIPPYRLPKINIQLKKLSMRVRCFLKEAVPYVFGGIFIMNLFYETTNIVGVIGKAVSPVLKGILGLPEGSIAALIIGTIRKDAAVALLDPLNLNNEQIVVAVIVLTLYFPCVATFAVLFKELGIKDTTKAILIMLTVTLITGGVLNLLFQTNLSIELIIVFEVILILLAGLIISFIPNKAKILEE